MYDVVLFGGTDEGHKIADFLSEQKVSYVVCVATEYGAELLDMKNVRVGRMTAEEMADFFDENSVRLVIDATHPYAEFVTENIKKAFRQTGRILKISKQPQNTLKKQQETYL